MSKSKKNDYAGLKVKYIVRKVDTGELVDECFVLRPQKDKAAIAALYAYADATENKVLAVDIRKWMESIIQASGKGINVPTKSCYTCRWVGRDKKINGFGHCWLRKDDLAQTALSEGCESWELKCD